MDDGFNWPPLSKVAISLGVGSTLLVYLQFIDGRYFRFDPKFIFHRREYWRLFTGPFFVTGRLWGLLTYFSPFALAIIGLERRLFLGRKATGFFIFLLATVSTEIAGYLFGFSDIGVSIWLSLEYLYSRLYPKEHIAAGWRIAMVYFPWLHGFLLQWNASTAALVWGIFLGHLLLYFLFILPVMVDRPILKTPTILKKIFHELEG
jgi:hypothetical protein